MISLHVVCPGQSNQVRSCLCRRHHLLSVPPEMAPSEIMGRIKGRTASRLFEEFPHLKKSYWGARGYFCTAVGQMTEEMIKQYMEHHFEPNPNDNFRMEPE